MTLERKSADLVSVLDRHDKLAIAVSGGVDSMTLAHIAQRYSRAAVTIMHAVSAAVPAEATARVRRHAQAHSWRLHLIDAGEMADAAYRSNPIDRCFHCKTNLYRRIRALSGLPIASGTNVDDLSDYRPGLTAAQKYEVVHPFVEAGIGKREIYAIAQRQALHDLAALQAQPCLASRIETGIAVDERSLQFIEHAEQELGALMPDAESIRCRITAAGVVFECTPLPEGEERRRIERWAAERCERNGRCFAGMRTYRRGAAFLRSAA